MNTNISSIINEKIGAIQNISLLQALSLEAKSREASDNFIFAKIAKNYRPTISNIPCLLISVKQKEHYGDYFKAIIDGLKNMGIKKAYVLIADGDLLTIQLQADDPNLDDESALIKANQLGKQFEANHKQYCYGIEIIFLHWNSVLNDSSGQYKRYSDICITLTDINKSIINDQEIIDKDKVSISSELEKTATNFTFRHKGSYEQCTDKVDWQHYKMHSVKYIQHEIPILTTDILYDKYAITDILYPKDQTPAIKAASIFFRKKNLNVPKWYSFDLKINSYDIFFDTVFKSHFGVSSGTKNLPNKMLKLIESKEIQIEDESPVYKNICFVFRRYPEIYTHYSKIYSLRNCVFNFSFSRKEKCLVEISPAASDFIEMLEGYRQVHVPNADEFVSSVKKSICILYIPTLSGIQSSSMDGWIFFLESLLRENEYLLANSYNTQMYFIKMVNIPLKNPEIFGGKLINNKNFLLNREQAIIKFKPANDLKKDSGSKLIFNKWRQNSISSEFSPVVNNFIAMLNDYKKTHRPHVNEFVINVNKIILKLHDPKLSRIAASDDMDYWIFTLQTLFQKIENSLVNNYDKQIFFINCMEINLIKQAYLIEQKLVDNSNILSVRNKARTMFMPNDVVNKDIESEMEGGTRSQELIKNKGCCSMM